MKNTPEGINSRLHTAEDQISYLGDQKTVCTQTEHQKEKRIFKNEKSTRDLWDSFKHNNVCLTTYAYTPHLRGIEEEREQGIDHMFEEIMTEIFNLVKEKDS